MKCKQNRAGTETARVEGDTGEQQADQKQDLPYPGGIHIWPFQQWGRRLIRVVHIIGVVCIISCGSPPSHLKPQPAQDGQFSGRVTGDAKRAQTSRLSGGMTGLRAVTYSWGAGARGDATGKCWLQTSTQGASQAHSEFALLPMTGSIGLCMRGCPFQTCRGHNATPACCSFELDKPGTSQDAAERPGI